MQVKKITSKNLFSSLREIECHKEDEIVLIRSEDYIRTNDVILIKKYAWDMRNAYFLYVDKISKQSVSNILTAVPMLKGVIIEKDCENFDRCQIIINYCKEMNINCYIKQGDSFEEVYSNGTHYAL